MCSMKIIQATDTATRRHCHMSLITAGQEHRVSVIHGAESAVTRTAAIP